jgi:hypothetical protein
VYYRRGERFTDQCVYVMPAKEEAGCDSGSENLSKYESRDILHSCVERRDQIFAVAEWAER